MNAGEELGIYRLVARLGAGGMGEVWQAEDTRLRRTVAIKILSEAIAANEESQLRFLREARTAAPLYHPNIATIHAIEQQAGRSFIVMEYVSGETLKQKISRGALPEQQVRAIGSQVASALEEAHRHGIVHRDIKPENIVFSGDKVKVLDFGIAKVVGPRAASGGEITGVVTEAGMILGTVYYMSPEQALGKPLDPRTDLFSLGVVMYQALTGRLPFRGETITETLTRIIRDDPPPIRQINPGVSAGMGAIVGRCLQKDREHRYATAGDLIAELSANLATPAPVPAEVATEPISAVGAPAEPTIELAAPTPRPEEATLAATGNLAGAAATAQTAAPTIAASATTPRGGRMSTIGLWIAIGVAILAAVTFAMRRDGKPATAAVAGAAPVASVAQAPGTAELSDPITLGGTQSDSKRAIVELAAPVESSGAKPPAVALTAPAPEVQEKPEARDAKVEAEDSYQRGLDYLGAGNRGLAALAFAAAVAKDPTHSPARMKLARGALMMGKLPEALRQYAMAFEHRARLSERDAEFAAVGAAAAQRDLDRARELGKAFDERHPGDEELAALQQAMKRAEKPPSRPRRKP